MCLHIKFKFIFNLIDLDDDEDDSEIAEPKSTGDS